MAEVRRARLVRPRLAGAGSGGRWTIEEALRAAEGWDDRCWG
ncbi:MAG TPA: hypothetical protein VH112_07020 [Acidimicrobiales bacterium]|nr:hypothetical protein [Acidimicrobiales bacterium]